ncbi:hypothetical protein E0Z10_g5087 [Xylaria hypoxylon]|uniref:Uncharacterized protein n=1 Tax=Xylaria hypoxylon TaxID=37992 RepID=A0A4Z0YII3_9PEZI|nr:hypothetical protein E0Z10_g5087 [Xylaria hypoxylon]
MPPTSPGQGDPPKNRNSQRDPRQYHRNHGKFARRHRNHRPYTRQPGNRHNHKHSFGVRRTPWPSTEALELGLHPRTFDEMHTERVYLLNVLQSRDRQALELLRRLPALDECINQQCHQRHQRQQDDQYQETNPKVKVRVNGVPVNEINNQEKRKEGEEEGRKLQNARRQRRWLRQQIEGTVDAEREILTRLSELHVEIQCRERWCQVERERAASEFGYDQTGFEYAPYQQSHWYQYPDWNSLLYPNMYPYQPYPDTNAGYPGYAPSSLHPVGLRHGFGGPGGHDEVPLVAAQQYPLAEAHGNWIDGMWRPESYQAGRGE